MQIPIGDHSFRTHNDADLYVVDSRCDDGDLRISAVTGGCSLNIDMSVDEMLRFRDMLTEAVAEAFQVQPAIPCPACGYTKLEAELNGDHQNCRRFPFFPGEKGKSYAK